MSDSITQHDNDQSSTRKVLAVARDVQNACVDVARSAHRQIRIFTHDLEPQNYNQLEFLEAVKHLVLTHRGAKVQILVMDSDKAVRSGHRLVETMRRLSSFFEVRRVAENFRHHGEAFLLADRSGLVFRSNAERNEGIADTDSPQIVSRYLEFFDEVWVHSEPDPELRRLHV